MSARIAQRVLVCCVLLALVGCAGARKEFRRERPLRIGTSANAPNLIYRENGKVLGPEAELARWVARRLERPLQFVLLEPDECIGALLTGEVDIWVSGLTLEEVVPTRAAFTEPFLQSGLLAVCRADKADAYDSVRTLRTTKAKVVVRKGSRADRKIRYLLPKGRPIVVETDLDAFQMLENDRADVYVDDAPVIFGRTRQASSHWTVLPWALTVDLHVWAVRPTDVVLLKKINHLFRQWKQDGSLHSLLGQYLPVQR